MNLTGGYLQSAGSHMPISDFSSASGLNAQTALLDVFFPGFSLLSSAFFKYSNIDLTKYFTSLVALGVLLWGSRYVSQWAWEFMGGYLMSTADIRIDDEMYNMVMAWIAKQNFAKRSRRFVANTNLNSRMWWLFRDSSDDNEDEDEDGSSNSLQNSLKGNKKLQYTPSFGVHYFWFRGRPFIFNRVEDRNQNSWGTISERESISISSFGRNPALLKELLDECRATFSNNDVNRTIIYRGALKKGTSEPAWTRCSSRASRPFSTVVLDESVKENILEDMSDYLHPSTRRWYSNRGIPYRRGYLLYGPPGTGKSSLAFAIAGYFKLKIYIVSLNSPAMNEENLASLFSELPKKCLVLLEDIDTAGLTHTRDEKQNNEEEKPVEITPNSGSVLTSTNNTNGGRISLSALLNILDGVASHEGRVLIMTTNHIEKLDEALIRPGRVDMSIKFDLASADMNKTIFRAIFATLEGDIPRSTEKNGVVIRSPKESIRLSEGEAKKMDPEALEAKRLSEEKKISDLATKFAELIPPMTFSPAEVQGYLLKNKRHPERAVANASDWVKSALTEKKKKEREEREKEEKEKLAREKAEKEKKEKLEKEKLESDKKEANATEEK